LRKNAYVILGAVFLLFSFTCSCGTPTLLSQPIKLKKIHNKYISGKIIDIISYHYLQLPVILDGNSIYICEDCTLQKTIKHFVIPEKPDSYFIWSPDSENNASKTSDAVSTDILMTYTSSNNAYLTRFRIEISISINQQSISVSNVSIDSFWTTKIPDAKVICTLKDANKSVFAICQSTNQKDIYIYDVNGKLIKKQNLKKESLLIPSNWFDSTLKVYDGRNFDFYKIEKGALVLKKIINLGQNGDINNCIYRRQINFPDYDFYWYALYDGKTIFSFNDEKMDLITKLDLDSVSASLDYVLFSYNQGLYFLYDNISRKISDYHYKAVLGFGEGSTGKEWLLKRYNENGECILTQMVFSSIVKEIRVFEFEPLKDSINFALVGLGKYPHEYYIFTDNGVYTADIPLSDDYYSDKHLIETIKLR